MRSFVKKDLLIFWRDRKELITAIVLPIILVVVLNFAFSGLLGNDGNSSLDLELAVVNEDDESNAMSELKEKLVNKASLGEEEALAIVEQASNLIPTQMLFDYLESEELKEWVTYKQLEEAEAVVQVENGDLDGILVIPDGFNAESLFAAFTGESPAETLKFKMETETNNNSILFNLIDGFLENMNYQFALQQVEGPKTEVSLPKGGFEEVSAGKGFTITQYFTIAMSALFALFIAATVGTKTGEEIRQQVFNRILLTNSNPMKFLIGKMFATFCLSCLQMMVVIILSHFILDVFPGRSISFWLVTVGIIALLSLAIAGLSAIFTSIALRTPNIDAALGIFMIVILTFGIIGGNFVPKYILPDWLQQIGEWTPNGLSLVMLTEWVQFEELSSIVWQSVLMIGFFLLCAAIGLAMYPKRGRA